MTRDEMCKRSFKPYMLLDYKTPGMEEPLEVMLISICFDTEICMVQLFDIIKPNGSIEDAVPIHISMLNFQVKKLKIIK